MKKKIILLITILNFQLNYSQKNIEISYNKRSDKSINFSYSKKVPGSYYLTIEFTKLTNCNRNSTFKKVVKHNSGNLFTLKPDDKDKDISFSYNLRYTFGNPKPKIKDDITYVIPFTTGKSIKIIEASNIGEKYFGSDKPIGWKSFINYSKKSDTIRSMRKGIVVKIKNIYSNNIIKKSFTTKRNSILIEHEDGTYSSYKGFNKNEIFVKLGQKVYPHTPLGKTEKFNNNYRLDFNVFHYLKNILNDEKSTLKNRKHRIKYLEPNFLIDNKIQKIKTGDYHKISFNEEIKLQEFSKREKKNYKKNPNEFE